VGKGPLHPTYAIEFYAPSTDSGAFLETAARIGSATEEMRLEGTVIRHARSVLLREDEICFLLIEASSINDVAEAARRAGLVFDRVLEVDVTLPSPPQTAPLPAAVETALIVPCSERRIT
jgi:hypothetical protein